MILPNIFQNKNKDFNFYFVDQYDDIRSGPGLFVKNLLELNKEYNLNIVFLSQNISNSSDFCIKIPSINKKGKFFTLINIFINSIYFLFYRVSIPRGRFFVNSYISILFTFWIGNFTLFVNDCKFLYDVKLNKWIFSLISRSSNKIIFNSQHLQRKIVQEIGINVTSLVLNKTVNNQGIFNKYSKVRNRVIITFAKNDWKFGNLEKLLKWLSNCNKDNFYLRVIGITDVRNSELNSLIKKYNLINNVNLIGLVSNQELLDLLSESSIFVNFCPHEAFGVASIEAIYSNNLLITCDDDCGLVYSMKDLSFGLIISNQLQLMEIVDNFSFHKWGDKISADALKVKNAFGFEVFKNNVLNIFSK
jgi:glycosyltransferase involved in cell wall biosynthesis